MLVTASISMFVNYRLILEVLITTIKTVQMTLHVGLSYIIVSLPQIFLKSNSTSQCLHFYFIWDGQGIWHVWGRGEVRARFWWVNRKEIGPFKTKVEMGECENWSSRQRMISHRLDWSGSGYDQVSGSCEYSNKPSSSIKCGEFLD
jgi:hypothetical protein